MEPDPGRTMLTFVARAEAARAAAAHERLVTLEGAARTLAVMLREEFGARDVIVFGSVARGEAHAHMDLDLAVTGLPADRYFEALGALLMRAPCPVDLVRLEDAAQSLRDHIAQEGRRVDGD